MPPGNIKYNWLSVAFWNKDLIQESLYGDIRFSFITHWGNNTCMQSYMNTPICSIPRFCRISYAMILFLEFRKRNRKITFHYKYHIFLLKLGLESNLDECISMMIRHILTSISSWPSGLFRNSWKRNSWKRPSWPWGYKTFFMLNSVFLFLL